MLSPVKQKSISPPSSKSPGGSPASSKSASSPSIAPPTADVTPVITGDGRIYHPCHGHSFRAVSIFDLFPGIVRYQSKRFTERDRVDFLLAHSERSFLVNVDEAAMWLTALKYLLNDSVLRPFDRLSPELRFVLRSYMSNHRKRTTLLTSIRTHGFLHVLSSLHQKVPASRDDIRRKMRTAERQRLKREAEMARRAIEAREEARRAYEHQMQMAAAAHYHSMYGYRYGHGHGPAHGHGHGYNGHGNVGNVGYNSYNVNVAPFAPVADDAYASAQRARAHAHGHPLGGHAAAYAQEQLQGTVHPAPNAEEARANDIDIDADAWELVTEMVEQIKVEQKDVDGAEVEVEMVDETDQEGSGHGRAVEVELEEDEAEDEDEEVDYEDDASDVYQVIFEAMTVQEGLEGTKE